MEHEVFNDCLGLDENGNTFHFRAGVIRGKNVLTSKELLEVTTIKPGFMRERSDYKINRDENTLEYEVVDREIYDFVEC